MQNCKLKKEENPEANSLFENGTRVNGEYLLCKVSIWCAFIFPSPTFLFYTLKQFNVSGQLLQVGDQITFFPLQLLKEPDCQELPEQISVCWTLPALKTDWKPGSALDSSPQPSLMATQLFSHSSPQIYSLPWFTAASRSWTGLACCGWKD